MDTLLPPPCYLMLHIGVGPSQAETEAGATLVVTDSDKRFGLREDLWIERLDKELATNIQKACEPPHFNIGSVEQDRHLYALVRQAPLADASPHESMGDLFAAAALSRLVNPTSIGDRYCAKIFHFGLRDSAIQALQFRGISPDVIISRNHRDWLSVEDAEKLRALVPWLAKEKHMHRRVHRAYWNHEYAMRSYYLDARWTLVVSGLEALLSVGKGNLRWQFRDRVRQLATEFGVSLTDDELDGAYQLRSKLVHAEGFLFSFSNILPASQHNELYEKMELLLRQVIYRCLVDESFGNFFRDDAAVEGRWPLNPKPKERNE